MTRFCLTLLVCLLFVPVAGTYAQSNNLVCTTNRNAPPLTPHYWPSDTEVKVYFVGQVFTAEQKAALMAGMDAWTSATPASGVKFIYAGETEGIKLCDSCLTVERRQVHKFDRKHYAYFYPAQLDRSGLLVAGWIAIDIGTISAQALQGFMVHELGHSMGLGDCPSCKKKQTIMNRFPGINRDNGLIAPSTCDRETVNRIYEAERRLARNTATAKAGNDPE